MRIVVCAKEVLDPDAVNSYAVAGRLEIGDDGRTLTQAAIPALMNAYDEQAIEAALRIRQARMDCTISVVSAGPDQADLLRNAAALGVDEIAAVALDTTAADSQVVARVLAAYIRWSGGAGLVLCGRQASDDDQGIVPGLIGELLDMPVITIARAVEIQGAPDDATVRVTRVTSAGDETVEARCPAVVTISNELGQPRYPTTAGAIAARRMQATATSVDDLTLGEDDLRPGVTLVRQFVPSIQGDCELISGDTPTELAANLIARLRSDQVLQ